MLMIVVLQLQTIIECLKLSCTGELPPNARSGHSFIHDPKVVPLSCNIVQKAPFSAKQKE